MDVYSYDRTAPRHKQKGKDKQKAKQYYKKHRSEIRQRSNSWRKKNKSKLKRYEKLREKNPAQHHLRPAAEVNPVKGVEFFDEELGQDGKVVSLDSDNVEITTEVGGAHKVYDLFDFLDLAVLLDAEDELALLHEFDKLHDFKPEEDPDDDYSYDRPPA